MDALRVMDVLVLGFMGIKFLVMMPVQIPPVIQSVLLMTVKLVWAISVL